METFTVTDIMFECNSCYEKAKKGSVQDQMIPCVISFRWLGTSIDKNDIKDICLKRFVDEDFCPNWEEKYREEIKVKIEEEWRGIYDHKQTMPCM